MKFSVALAMFAGSNRDEGRDGLGTIVRDNVQEDTRYVAEEELKAGVTDLAARNAVERKIRADLRRILGEISTRGRHLEVDFSKSHFGMVKLTTQLKEPR